MTWNADIFTAPRTVVPFVPAVVQAYQKAFAAHFGVPAPRVTRRSTKGYIIHGSEGDSGIITEAKLRRITKAMQNWSKEQA